MSESGTIKLAVLTVVAFAVFHWGYSPWWTIGVIVLVLLS